MNKKNCFARLNKRIENSKVDMVKKALYFLIVPFVILLVGIILLTTVGFSKGIDFSGGQTFKVYVNNEDKLENSTVYDLNKDKDYNEVYKKITFVLQENGANLISYQTSTVDIKEYDVYGGQAVKVTYQSNIEDQSLLRADLIEAFGYESYDGAISSIDEVIPVSYTNLVFGLIAGILLGIIAITIYMSFRFSRSAFFTVFLQSALDIFLTLGLMLICRVPVNLTVGIVVLAAFFMSILNCFVYYNKVRENRKAGLYDKLSNSDIANRVTKQIAVKKTVVYIGAILVSLLFIIFSVNAIKVVALGILFACIASYYTSTFLLPTLWAVIDKPKKKKQKA